jgi:hypothetical protein
VRAEGGGRQAQRHGLVHVEPAAAIGAFPKSKWAIPIPEPPIPAGYAESCADDPTRGPSAGEHGPGRHAGPGVRRLVPPLGQGRGYYDSLFDRLQALRRAAGRPPAVRRRVPGRAAGGRGARGGARLAAGPRRHTRRLLRSRGRGRGCGCCGGGWRGAADGAAAGGPSALSARMGGGGPRPVSSTRGTCGDWGASPPAAAGVRVWSRQLQIRRAPRATCSMPGVELPRPGRGRLGTAQQGSAGGACGPGWPAHRGTHRRNRRAIHNGRARAAVVGGTGGSRASPSPRWNRRRSSRPSRPAASCCVVLGSRCPQGRKTPSSCCRTLSESPCVNTWEVFSGLWARRSALCSHVTRLTRVHAFTGVGVGGSGAIAENPALAKKVV